MKTRLIIKLGTLTAIFFFHLFAITGHAGPRTVGNGGSLCQNQPCDLFFVRTESKLPQGTEFQISDFPEIQSEIKHLYDLIERRNINRSFPELALEKVKFFRVNKLSGVDHMNVETGIQPKQISFTYTYRKNSPDFSSYSEFIIIEFLNDFWNMLSPRDQALQVMHEYFHALFPQMDHEHISPFIKNLAIVSSVLDSQEQAIQQNSPLPLLSSAEWSASVKFQNLLYRFYQPWYEMTLSNYEKPIKDKYLQEFQNFYILKSGGGVVFGDAEKELEKSGVQAAIDSVILDTSLKDSGRVFHTKTTFLHSVAQLILPHQSTETQVCEHSQFQMVQANPITIEQIQKKDHSSSGRYETYSRLAKRQASITCNGSDNQVLKSQAGVTLNGDQNRVDITGLTSVIINGNQNDIENHLIQEVRSDVRIEGSRNKLVNYVGSFQLKGSDTQVNKTHFVGFISIGGNSSIRNSKLINKADPGSCKDFVGPNTSLPMNSIITDSTLDRFTSAVLQELRIHQSQLTSVNLFPNKWRSKIFLNKKLTFNNVNLKGLQLINTGNSNQTIEGLNLSGNNLLANHFFEKGSIETIRNKLKFEVYDYNTLILNSIQGNPLKIETGLESNLIFDPDQKLTTWNSFQNYDSWLQRSDVYRPDEVLTLKSSKQIAKDYPELLGCKHKKVEFCLEDFDRNYSWAKPTICY